MTDNRNSGKYFKSDAFMMNNNILQFKFNIYRIKAAGREMKERLQRELKKSAKREDDEEEEEERENLMN